MKSRDWELVKKYSQSLTIKSLLIEIPKESVRAQLLSKETKKGKF